MAMIDKVNGKLRVNCIIMTRGVIPNFAGVLGPILQPRPIEVNEVLLLLKMGVDVRAVERNKKVKVENAVKLNEQLVMNMINEFENGKKPVENKRPIQPVQQPKQQPVQQKKVEEQPKEVVVEKKVEEQPKEVVVEKKVEEQPKEQPVINNNKNKNNKKK